MLVAVIMCCRLVASGNPPGDGGAVVAVVAVVGVAVTVAVAVTVLVTV
jgi:hypothetical protein